MVDQAKAAFQNLKKCFSKKKNELKKSNKSQINQIFTSRIKSYLKKDFLSASFMFCIKLLNAPFPSRLQNKSRTHFFLFLLFFFFILNKTFPFRVRHDVKRTSKIFFFYIYIYINYMIHCKINTITRYLK